MINIKGCPICGKEFYPKHNRIAYCSKECYLINNRKRSLARYFPRSKPKYQTNEEYLEQKNIIYKNGSICVRCGFSEAVFLHDIMPRSEGGNPLDFGNLLPLCPNCHVLLHRNKWKLWELDLDKKVFEYQYWLIQILKSEDYIYQR